MLATSKTSFVIFPTCCRVKKNYEKNCVMKIEQQKTSGSGGYRYRSTEKRERKRKQQSSSKIN